MVIYCWLFVSDFQSITGYFAVGSLILLPVWLFALHKDVITYWAVPLLLQHAITFTLTVGRSLCALVEVFNTSFLIV